MARNPAPQYTDHRLAWGAVEWIVADRAAEERDGSWRRRMEAIEADVVMDLICYTPEQNRLMVEAFEGRIQPLHPLRHHLGLRASRSHCRTRESDRRRPISDYGRQKAEIEADLIDPLPGDGLPRHHHPPRPHLRPQVAAHRPPGHPQRRRGLRQAGPRETVHLPSSGARRCTTFTPTTWASSSSRR